MARDVTLGDRVLLLALCTAGAVSVAHLAEWWFRPDHVSNLALYLGLSLVFWYAIGRILLGWTAYLGVRVPTPAPAPGGMRVAIFTTSSPGEPLSMFEKTLAACARIGYPHRTYLLDDTQDPRFREVAERHGAVWLGLVGLPGAKAGKINRALELTDEEFVLVLDPDHLPFPELLDRVLGHFEDERVGFVQVSQGYYNQDRSFVARGAAEQTYGFYGPMMMGMFGRGCSVAIGANCTFRRAALESVGGHGVGLAEDLVTSIRLHAAGWRSVYVPEILSRGLVPEDLGSFYRQQLKWARGVYEVLFSELPRLFPRLTGWQRLSYLGIGTYYLFGATMPVFLLIPYLYLWTGVQPADMRFEGLLTAALPVGLSGMLVYLFAQRWLCHPAVERGIHWRGMLLKVACWPVFLAGTALAVVGAEIPYVPTAKEARRGRFLRLAWPHLLLLALYAATLGWLVSVRLFDTSEGVLVLSSEAVWGMVAFASVAAASSTGALYGAYRARTPPEGSAWDSIQPDRLGGAGRVALERD
jgi:cellulose synthase (UDP-forming)